MSPKRRQRLRDAQQGGIQVRHNFGPTISQIAFDMQLPKSAVNRLTRVRNGLSAAYIKQPGRPRISSKQHDRLLVRTALSNTCVPLSELCVLVNSWLSISTIKRRLKESQISKHKAAVRA
jgi:hypothetical protein